jgi:hypothetical protein
MDNAFFRGETETIFNSLCAGFRDFDRHPDGTPRRAYC